MANVILIPDDTTETQFTTDLGDLLVLAAGATLCGDGAPAVDSKSPIRACSTTARSRRRTPRP